MQWVLMANHYHLLIETPEANLAEVTNRTLGGEVRAHLDLSLTLALGEQKRDMHLEGIGVWE
jgi:hypothetical protein